MIAAGLELAKVGESLNTAEARDLDPKRAGRDRNDFLGRDANSNAVGLREDRRRRWAVMLMTVAGIIAFRNDAIGFLAGMLCHWSFVMLDKLDEHVSRGEGRIRLQEEEPANSQHAVR